MLEETLRAGPDEIVSLMTITDGRMIKMMWDRLAMVTIEVFEAMQYLRRRTWPAEHYALPRCRSRDLYFWDVAAVAMPRKRSSDDSSLCFLGASYCCVRNPTLNGRAIASYRSCGAEV